MSHYCALLSIVFMMTFVALFDCMHLQKLNIRFCKEGLLTSDDVDRIKGILLACEE